jgi:hypothetical protein
MVSGDNTSLLYKFAGHRNGGGAAPSNNLREIGSRQKEEICGGGTPQKEISASD